MLSLLCREIWTDWLFQSEAGPINGVSMRRRLFGRSHDSAASKESRHSKEISPSSPLLDEKDHKKEKKDRDSKDSKEAKDKDASSLRHARAKRSVDATHNGNTRLSIFGSPFSGSIGKARKPPPRYSM